MAGPESSTATHKDCHQQPPNTPSVTPSVTVASFPPLTSLLRFSLFSPSSSCSSSSSSSL
ncbi:hypothetical protein E2C01_087670 [Portunus trituberculatus]|uniref:Uncharacterized protein n=1 Tax=Portunus trituberculatus TaxID=210409 RepID=A0A5B7JD45_PORTR|nr:hypothetical protein [Portunus trituberculatus]